MAAAKRPCKWCPCFLGQTIRILQTLQHYLGFQNNGCYDRWIRKEPNLFQRDFLVKGCPRISKCILCGFACFKLMWNMQLACFYVVESKLGITIIRLIVVESTNLLMLYIPTMFPCRRNQMFQNLMPKYRKQLLWPKPPMTQNELER